MMAVDRLTRLDTLPHEKNAELMGLNRLTEEIRSTYNPPPPIEATLTRT